MLASSRQRVFSRIEIASRRRSACKASCEASRTPSVALRFYHHTTMARSAGQNAAPPLVWTTHRLKEEQIAKVDAIFHKIIWLDMFETSMLTELINHKLGLTMTPKQRKALQKTMDARALGGGAGGVDDKKEEAKEDAGPKLVDLKLAAFDAKAKIKVIKEVRAIAGLGLKEAKEMVESAPKVIQKGLKPEAAEELKKKLEDVGATIELV